MNWQESILEVSMKTVKNFFAEALIIIMMIKIIIKKLIVRHISTGLIGA